MAEEGDINERVAGYQNYLTSKDNIASVRISKKALTTVATWAEMHDSNIMLADLPMSLAKYNLI